jgi:hypothetical protein
MQAGADGAAIFQVPKMATAMAMARSPVPPVMPPVTVWMSPLNRKVPATVAAGRFAMNGPLSRR